MSNQDGLLPGEGEPPVDDEFEAIIDGGFRIPDWGNLTPEQQEQLTNGPGWVEHGIDELDDFATFEDFRDRQGNIGYARNNFHLQFIHDRFDPDDEMAEAWAPKPATVRFQILFPTLDESVRRSLDDKMLPNGFTPDNDKMNADESLLRKFFVAYKLIRQLVDAKDEDSIPADYLTR